MSLDLTTTQLLENIAHEIHTHKIGDWSNTYFSWLPSEIMLMILEYVGYAEWKERIYWVNFAFNNSGLTENHNKAYTHDSLETRYDRNKKFLYDPKSNDYVAYTARQYGVKPQSIMVTWPVFGHKAKRSYVESNGSLLRANEEDLEEDIPGLVAPASVFGLVKLWPSIPLWKTPVTNTSSKNRINRILTAPMARMRDMRTARGFGRQIIRHTVWLRRHYRITGRRKPGCKGVGETFEEDGLEMTFISHRDLKVCHLKIA